MKGVWYIGAKHELSVWRVCVCVCVCVCVYVRARVFLVFIYFLLVGGGGDWEVSLFVCFA